MTKYEFYSLVMSAIALVAAAIGTILSIGNLKVSKNAIKIATDAEKTANGELKMNIREKISAARNEVLKARMMLEEYKEDFPKKSLDKRKQFLNSTLEDYFNSYESACNLYFKGNVNKEDFTEEYKEEIKDLVESEKFNKYFEPDTSRYQAMIKFNNESK